MTQTSSIGVVAHYNLLERLDPAGPGVLYRARDTRHGRTVIVRVCEPGPDPDQLLAQATALAGLSHQNAIAVFGSGRHGDQVYVAFEHVTGRSLRAEIGGRAMNARRAVELAVEVAGAVADAHALGFFHAGLSPDAIAVTAKGHAKIAAFSLGTRLGFEESGGTVRLADYEAPEEARGEASDERADVYSIGAVLYEMLTARRPMHRGASAPSATNPQIPAALDEVVLKAVSPNRERRHGSAAELAAALRHAASRLELPDVPAEGAASERSPAAGRLALTAVAVLALLMIMWWLMRS